MASVAHDGLARAVRPAHSMVDGDTIFGLATGEVDLTSAPSRLQGAGTRNAELNLLLVAAADVFAAACTHAVLSATSIGDAAELSRPLPHRQGAMNAPTPGPLRTRRR